jgi:hypothetical protein
MCAAAALVLRATTDTLLLSPAAVAGNCMRECGSGGTRGAVKH